MKIASIFAKLFLTLALCPMLAFSALAQSSNATSNFSPEQLVVMVNGTDALGKPVRGAGLVVGKQEGGMLFVVTARHVTHSLTGAVNTLTVEFKDARGKQFPAYLQPAQFDKGLDLALLGIPPTDLPANLDSYLSAPVARLKDPAQPGEEVTLIGQTAGVLWARSPQPDKVGTARSTEIEVISNSGAPGLSGGAALDQNLNILGMVTSDDRGVIRVLPLRVVAEQLEKASYVFTLADVGGEERSSVDRYLSQIQTKDAAGGVCGVDCLPTLDYSNGEDDYETKTYLETPAQITYQNPGPTFEDVDITLIVDNEKTIHLHGVYIRGGQGLDIYGQIRQKVSLLSSENYIICMSGRTRGRDDYLAWQAKFSHIYDDSAVISFLPLGPKTVVYGEARPPCPLLDEKSEFLTEIKF